MWETHEYQLWNIFEFLLRNKIERAESRNFIHRMSVSDEFSDDYDTYKMYEPVRKCSKQTQNCIKWEYMKQEQVISKICLSARHLWWLTYGNVNIISLVLCHIHILPQKKKKKNNTNQNTKVATSLSAMLSLTWPH